MVLEEEQSLREPPSPTHTHIHTHIFLVLRAEEIPTFQSQFRGSEGK